MKIKELIENYTDEYIELELHHNGEYYKTIFRREDIQGLGELYVLGWEVVMDINKNFVFVIETEDNKVGVAKKQLITLGELTSEGFLVKDGLQEGQLIATAGLQTLLDGQKVKLQ